MESHVGHVAGILETALDFERGDAGINEGLDIGGLVVVLETERICVAHEWLPVFGKNVVREAARLRTFAAVGRSAAMRIAHVTLAAV